MSSVPSSQHWTARPSPLEKRYDDDLSRSGLVSASVSVIVVQERTWSLVGVDGLPLPRGNRRPVPDGPPRIEVTAGDYCAGPEHLTIEQARAVIANLTDAITWAEQHSR